MVAHVLDLRPMMFALEHYPAQFTRLKNGDVRHIDTKHDIHFKWYGGVGVQTACEVRCECVDGTTTRMVEMVTTRRQRRELKEAAVGWVRDYWLPLHDPEAARALAEAKRINRQFADHFAPSYAAVPAE